MGSFIVDAIPLHACFEVYQSITVVVSDKVTRDVTVIR